LVRQARLVAGDKAVQVAVKTVDLGDPDAAAALFKEVKVLADLRHPGVVRLVGVCREGAGSMHVVLEFCPYRGLDWLLPLFVKGQAEPATQERAKAVLAAGGGLGLDSAPSASEVEGEDLVLEARRRVALLLGGELGAGANEAFYRVACALAEALEYLHRMGYFHGDVKPSNVLVDGRGAVKLADYGLAKAAARSRASAVQAVVAGNSGFMAPEVKPPNSSLLKSKMACPRTTLSTPF